MNSCLPISHKLNKIECFRFLEEDSVLRDSPYAMLD